MAGRHCPCNSTGGERSLELCNRKAIMRKPGFVLNDELIDISFINSQITGGMAVIWNDNKTESERYQDAILNSNLH